MKEKIKILVLIILFICMLVGINKLLENENSKLVENINTKLQNKNELNEETNSNTVENETEYVLKVTEETFEEEVLNSDKTVLIDFYADWCNPCKVLSPIVEKVAKENPDIKVVKINVDYAPKLSYTYSTYSIPTLVVIKNGEEVNRAVGVISENEILELVK